MTPSMIYDVLVKLEHQIGVQNALIAEFLETFDTLSDAANDEDFHGGVKEPLPEVEELSVDYEDILSAANVIIALAAQGHKQ